MVPFPNSLIAGGLGDGSLGFIEATSIDFVCFDLWSAGAKCEDFLEFDDEVKPFLFHL